MLLAHTHERGMHGKVVLALTANRHYQLDGIRAGDELAAIEKRQPLGAAILSGRNTWYLIPGKAATGVLKVHDGEVAEIGLAGLEVTSTPAQQVALSRQAKLR